MPKLGTRAGYVAYYFKHFITRIAVLRFLSLAVLMAGYFFTPCYCGPIGKDVTYNDPWWCKPCERAHKTRHSRGINDPVKDTFSIIIKRYETDISDYVKQLHTKLQIGNITKKQFRRNKLLPRKNFFKKIRRDDEKILPELHRQVQIYAITIQRLIDMEIHTEDGSFDVLYRTKTLNIAKSDINQLQCAVQLEIEEKRLAQPEQVPENFMDEMIPSAVNHLTDLLIRDYSILKEYHNFLKKCFTKMFRKGKKGRRNNRPVKNDKQKNKRTNKKLSQKSEQS